MTRFRYSRPKFRVTLVVAAAMTVTVCGMAWMLMAAFAVRHAGFYALMSAGVFFVFVSATMLVRYLRDAVVLAVQPTGLYDGRWRAQAVPWEAIREIVVRRKEDEVELDVYLWRPQAALGDAWREARPDHTIELAPLEGSPADIIGAIGRHAVVRSDDSAGQSGITPLLRARG